MKKITFWIPNLLGGGAEKVLVDILKHLDKNKYRITLISIYNKGIYLEDITEYVEYKYIFPNIKSKLLLKIIDKIIIKYFSKIIYKIANIKKQDIEIAFLEGSATKIVSNSASTKIAWVHTDMEKFKWSKMYYKNENDEINNYLKYDKIIFVSNQAKLGFIKRFDYKSSINQEMKIIYNPIFVKEIEKKSKQIDIKYNEFTVISIGRLIDVKGYKRLIEAHANIVGRFRHKLVIIGEGPDRNELIKLIKKLGVEESVNLLGFKNNPYPYIRSADVYICSSFVEGYPLSILEAVILEKPIISTKITGANEILGFGKYGYICNNDTEGIESALKKLMSDKKIRCELKEKTIKRKEILIRDNNIKVIEDMLDE